MPSYKLTYFNAPARGEVSRMLFNLAGVPFEDKRIAFEEWAAMKKRYMSCFVKIEFNYFFKFTFAVLTTTRKWPNGSFTPAIY